MKKSLLSVAFSEIWIFKKKTSTFSELDFRDAPSATSKTNPDQKWGCCNAKCLFFAMAVRKLMYQKRASFGAVAKKTNGNEDMKLTSRGTKISYLLAGVGPSTLRVSLMAPQVRATKISTI